MLSFSLPYYSVIVLIIGTCVAITSLLIKLFVNLKGKNESGNFSGGYVKKIEADLR